MFDNKNSPTALGVILLFILCLISFAALLSVVSMGGLAKPVFVVGVQ